MFIKSNIENLPIYFSIQEAQEISGSVSPR